MTAQPLFQFGTVTLHPTPDSRVIRLQTALGEQLFDIAERERVPKIPAHGTQNQLRRRLPPLEDYRSGCVLHGLFSLPATPAKLATHPYRVGQRRTWGQLSQIAGLEMILRWIIIAKATLFCRTLLVRRAEGVVRSEEFQPEPCREGGISRSSGLPLTEKSIRK